MSNLIIISKQIFDDPEYRQWFFTFQKTFFCLGCSDITCNNLILTMLVKQKSNY